MVAISQMKEKIMSKFCKLITVAQVEPLSEAALWSKLAEVDAVLLRTTQAWNERAIALASRETIEAQLNRKRALCRAGLQP